MQKSGTIVRYSAEELRAMKERGESQTDWAYVDALTSAEIEASIDWEEEGDFEGSVAYPGIPGIIRETTMFINDEVIQWFRQQDPDYLARMNEVLLSYVYEQRDKKR